jgi:hypothetical protein
MQIRWTIPLMDNAMRILLMMGKSRIVDSVDAEEISGRSDKTSIAEISRDEVMPLVVPNMRTACYLGAYI